MPKVVRNRAGSVKHIIISPSSGLDVDMSFGQHVLGARLALEGSQNKVCKHCKASEDQYDYSA